ncbi:hypothetical protein ACHHYP_20152 [Achlya hypogyna]|uniref:Uncharacterized protein n=1 Tax=Achlya hypogyna TaxID=1202772 RepID=A0A1V9Z2A4_ACHHY|nr:hypothetical protein ACHHYP_20152 [Achlya hypogyna]
MKAAMALYSYDVKIITYACAADVGITVAALGQIEVAATPAQVSAFAASQSCRAWFTLLQTVTDSIAPPCVSEVSGITFAQYVAGLPAQAPATPPPVATTPPVSTRPPVATTVATAKILDCTQKQLDNALATVSSPEDKQALDVKCAADVGVRVDVLQDPTIYAALPTSKMSAFAASAACEADVALVLKVYGVLPECLVYYNYKPASTTQLARMSFIDFTELIFNSKLDPAATTKPPVIEATTTAVLTRNPSPAPIAASSGGYATIAVAVLHAPFIVLAIA